MRAEILVSVVSVVVSAIAVARPGGLDARIGELERNTVVAPERVDLLYELSGLYEQAERFDDAVRVTRQILKAGETYDVRLRLGWLNLLARDFETAEESYLRATEIVPQSEDAWMGLQLVRIELGAWDEAADAGAVLLRLNPESYWGKSRQAYVRYMQEEYAAAEELYRRVLESRPEDGEMLLGLGLTRVRLGEVDQGRETCELARRVLGDDPRVGDCLGEPSGHPFTVGVYTTYLGFIDKQATTSLGSLTVTAKAQLPAGFGVWAGANASQYRPDGSDTVFLQLTPVLGAYYGRDGVGAELAITRVVGSDETVDSTWVAALTAGFRGDLLGTTLGVTTSAYPDKRVHQLHPRVHFYPRADLTLTLGPELILIGREETSGSTKWSRLWSGRLAAVWRTPIQSLWLHGGGYVGPRRFAVEEQGLAVWSFDGRFWAGCHVGAQVALDDRISVFGEIRYDYGKTFYTMGGTVGVLAGF